MLVTSPYSRDIPGVPRNRNLNGVSFAVANASAYVALAPSYPALAKQPVYVRKSLSAAETSWLEAAFGKALLITGSLEQILADPATAASAARASGIDLSRIPAGTDAFALLGKLPAVQRTQITAAIDKQFAAWSP